MTYSETLTHKAIYDWIHETVSNRNNEKNIYLLFIGKSLMT